MKKDFYDFEDLKSLIVRLRDKDSGCPWDIEQSFASIKPHTIEEAYEVADAIEQNDMDELKAELGDLLFQVIFHSQMASEENLFTIDDVIHHVTAKMIFRHPHVFENGDKVTAKEVENDIWEAQKAKEKESKHGQHYLDDVTQALPSLLFANKLQKRVHKVGFEYSDIEAIIEKLSEEIEELKAAQQSGNKDHMDEEFGDVLFVAALLGTKIKSNPEESLRKACLKFIKRFNAVEDGLNNDGISLNDATIDEMTAAWHQIKTNN